MMKRPCFLVRGYESRFNMKIRNSRVFFEKANKLAEENELIGLKSLIDYYSIADKIREKSDIKVFQLCEKARREFYQQHNYIRTLYLENLEGLCLFRLHQNRDAYKCFESILTNITYCNDSYLLFCAAQNAILVLCVSQSFTSALNLMKKHEKTYEFGLTNFI